MKKIVVTTDLSQSSKAGLRFAIQLASQYDVHLIFFNVIELLLPTRWSDTKAKIHMDDEIKKETENLSDFVKQTYKECKTRPGKFGCVVRYGAPVSEAIIEFANEANASYICIATRGAGKVKKLIGTHTSALIRNAAIPIFAIPKNYRRSKVKEILYASDFTAVHDELRLVKDFAKKLNSSVSVLHLETPLASRGAKMVFEMLRRSASRDVKYHLEEINLEATLGNQLNKAAKKFKSDLVALFSSHKRFWLDRLLFGSNSVRASFNSITPILVYPK